MENDPHPITDDPFFGLVEINDWYIQLYYSQDYDLFIILISEPESLTAKSYYLHEIVWC